jgi:predicted esterase
VLRELNGREVDVVIGFSQGAVFATVLLGHNLVRAKCVILMSGSDVMDTNQKPEPVSIHTPSLHFVGARDTLCTAEHSRLLMETYFVEPLMHTHRWGHVVPRGAAIKKMVLDFIGRHCTDNTNNDNLDDVTEVNDKINDT